ncbi:protein-L-isoaspartate O-methyltransferase family protein [Anianabacter salinae]|uniref:protein-L-isoaspartate O-methyltransferase family protein n=1 Tax=Anianabacter salinae TaxID=2851023 RepID=UPI00225DF3A9|nr:protein-L-isoaspartate O-methyltransferase [Anianabacter salinae]MBV0912681.1 protein-L-isoaspartate O-methyltransferase [Anianabacter salinae]
MADYAARRTFMVDTQIRPSDVTEYPLIEAMLAVPRERFVPGDKRETAYVGEHVALGLEDRVLLEPRTFAKMIEALDLTRNALVLDVGAGHGYSSAVIAHLAEAVVALEEDAAMASEAQTALSEYGADNVAVVEGALAAGAAQHGPYDVIVLEGAVEMIPDALIDQIKEGGRIAAIFMEGVLGTCRIGYKIDGRMTWRFAFNGTAPVLPGFAKAPAFQF